MTHNTTEFDPDAIRSLGQSVASRLYSGAESAQQQLQDAANLKLPREYQDLEQQINEAISLVAQMMALPIKQAELLVDRMNTIADDYERTEAASTDEANSLGRSIS